MRTMKRFLMICSSVLLIVSCAPSEETGVECYESWECGDGWTCVDGFCVEATVDGDVPVDKDAILPEGNEAAVETEELPEAEGQPDELIDTMVDEVSDQNDTVIEPDIDDTTDDMTDELLDTMNEADDTVDEDMVDDIPDTIDEDIVDEDTVDIQPDLDVDVPDDDVAPTVSSTVPADNATGVAVTAKVEIHFSEALNTSSIAGNFTIMQGATNVPFSSMWRGADNAVILTPNASLTAGLVYEVTVKTGVADPAGNQLAAQYVFDFTTSACGNSVTDSGIGEVCDDGVNDGSYDGCMPGCMAHAPYCGDGIVTAGSEVCDTALSVACNALGQGYANSDIAVCSIGCQGLETDVCVCASGYEKNGSGACIDIDECTLDTDGCAQNCQNTDGSHTCSCGSGYTSNADGHACDDNDECLANPCNDNGDGAAGCTNSTGSYDCSCSLNFEEKLGSCYDIDECTLNTDNCDVNAACANTPGSFTCTCNAYYSGSGTSCSFCNTDGQCGSGCGACGGGTTKCKDNGNGTSQCVQCIDNSQCDTGAGYVCNASNQCVKNCPTALSLGSWTSGNDGWNIDNDYWLRAGGYMHLDYIPGHSGSYTRSVTYASDIDLSGCSSATFKFSVELDDDPGDYGSDKSEKLYVQCSGNAGGSWVSMTPNPWPTGTQSSKCGSFPSYCAGGYLNDWSFAKTAQTISVPSACLTANARFQFQATGSTTWSLLAPGWYVYPATVN